MNTLGTIMLCAVILALAIAHIRRRNQKHRTRAIARVIWIIDTLKLRGGNEFTIQYMRESDALIDRYDITPHEVDIDSWDELYTIARKAYRTFCLLEYQKHAHLRGRLLKMLQHSSQLFDECFLAELLPLAIAYSRSSECIVTIRSLYKNMKDRHDAELSTFAHLDRIAH